MLQPAAAAPAGAARRGPIGHEDDDEDDENGPSKVAAREAHLAEVRERMRLDPTYVPPAVAALRAKDQAEDLSAMLAAARGDVEVRGGGATLHGRGRRVAWRADIAGGGPGPGPGPGGMGWCWLVELGGGATGGVACSSVLLRTHAWCAQAGRRRGRGKEQLRVLWEKEQACSSEVTPGPLRRNAQPCMCLPACQPLPAPRSAPKPCTECASHPATALAKLLAGPAS